MPTTRTPVRARRPRALRRLVRWTGAAYLLALAVLVALVYGPSERLWPVTLFLFGPRWAAAVPLALLLPLAAFVDRRLTGVLTLAAALLAGPLFGINVPWERLAAELADCRHEGRVPDVFPYPQSMRLSASGASAPGASGPARP